MGSKFPNVVKSSLYKSSPIILPPLLQPPPGRPAKNRKTKEKVRKAYLRSKIRQEKQVNKARLRGSTTQIVTKNPRISRKHVCSRCGRSGHNYRRCRSYTDGRGKLMTKQEQQEEFKRTIVVEVRLPGLTKLPATMVQCASLVRVNESLPATNEPQVYSDKDESGGLEELLEDLHLEAADNNKVLPVKNNEGKQGVRLMDHKIEDAKDNRSSVTDTVSSNTGASKSILSSPSILHPDPNKSVLKGNCKPNTSLSCNSKLNESRCSILTKSSSYNRSVQKIPKKYINTL